MFSSVLRRAATAAAIVMIVAGASAAQDPAPGQEPPPEHVHDMQHMDMPMDMDMSANGWHLMQDGSFYLLFNHQGSERGETAFEAPNWWMGMASRRAGRGDLTLTAMFSLDPATVGRTGYSELFQVGEAIDGRPIVDRQHPHDFWMQLSGAWRVPFAGNGVTVAGGISGEPALGPVAFMHRASAAAIPIAPLGHHTFDSTHVAFGVVTVGFDRGPFAVEGSVFNGREPDQDRWNFDFGPMDSVSARVWYRPTSSWEFQVSSGHLVEPEQLGHGNIVRTTASGSYFAGDDAHLLAATLAYGQNSTDEVTRHAAYGEITKAWGPTLASGRLEFVQVETVLLLTGRIPETTAGEAQRDTVGAFTLGAQRDLAQWKGITAAVGANATFYRVPDPLHQAYGAHPASFQLFVQLRPPVGRMGRMWNMRMAAPPAAMTGHGPMQHQ